MPPSSSRPMRLFVAEKPSVARDLARILGAKITERGAYRGSRVLITWCIGHVAELEEPQAYNPAWRTWRADALPMLPERFMLRPTQATREHWRLLAGWLNSPEVDQVVNACDAGREGELIFCYAQELSGCRKPVMRLWLNALTDAAVKTALHTMKPQQAYSGLADAARCRAEADWLVGLNATRALTLARRRQDGASELLTVGRVQTPTLAMLVQREEAIEAFEPEPYWQVACTLGVPGDTGASAPHAPAPAAQPPTTEGFAGTFKALYGRPAVVDGKKKIEHKIGSLAEAQKVVQDITGQAGAISLVQHKVHEEMPPLLHDLTSLQRLANIRYNLTAQATLDAAQGLYERHKAITYPRTDSNHLPATLQPGLMALLGRLQHSAIGQHVRPLLSTPPAWPPVSMGRMINDKEVSDHHAIIPTGKPPPPMGTSPAERQVYDLVLRRFVAAFYPPARISLGTLQANVCGHTFLGRGRMVLDAGWQVVEPPVGHASADSLLPQYSRNDAVAVATAVVDSLKTRPPPRLNEASLLGAMERPGAAIQEREVRLALKEQGLGTPATRANIIETLKKRSYVTTDGRSLVPSPEGRALLRALPVAELKSAELTGRWEAKLARVAKGQLARTAFMAETHAFVGTLVSQILAAAPPSAAPATAPGKRPEFVALGRAVKKGICPICGAAQVVQPETIRCAQGRSCSFVVFRTVAGRALLDDELQVILQGERTASLKGFTSRAGKRFAAKLQLDAAGRVAFIFS